MYAAGDGFVNPLGWSDAHIACKYGDAGAPVGFGVWGVGFRGFGFGVRGLEFGVP